MAIGQRLIMPGTARVRDSGASLSCQLGSGVPDCGMKISLIVLFRPGYRPKIIKDSLASALDPPTGNRFEPFYDVDPCLIAD